MPGDTRFWLGALIAMQVLAQDPASLMGASQGKQDPSNSLGTQLQTGDGQARIPLQWPPRLESNPDANVEKNPQMEENQRLAQEIQQAKAREKGPKRFAADLFEVRQVGLAATDGGISEDYVLGAGDRLAMNVFGSATFDAPLQVDGRGGVLIPKVGTVAVGGMSLGRARAAIQAKIGQIFSRSSVDLSVTKLREVRVFVLGEVYKPGAFLVPSLGSLINVLSLSGGPTAVGSYRDIRVIRGGRVVHSVDLYPLRAEGLGNLNFGFQNGDTVFVPLAQNQVLLEGGFTRVVATVPGSISSQDADKETEEERRVKREIVNLQARLGITPDKQIGGAGSTLRAATASATPGGAGVEGSQVPGSKPDQQASPRIDLMAGVTTVGAPKTPAERAVIEERLDLLQQYLSEIKTRNRGDQRIPPEADGVPNEMMGQPLWLSRWLLEGQAPAMQFEMLPTETAQDALRYAGGFALKAFAGSLTLRRVAADGSLDVTSVPAGDALAATRLQRGDTLTALPLRDSDTGAVTVNGWVRVQGLFARKEGQRVGDFLKELNLLLPDTYLERGELVRTTADGTKSYFSFNLAKAMAGDPEHNLSLEKRDTIELYRIGDLRLPQTLTVTGPVTRPGTFPYIKGMRASDLLFRAGVPQRSANVFVAELARTNDGQTSLVKSLDLTRLLSGPESSPIDLTDDNVNPVLEPYDQISVYAKPDFRSHRSITLSGQVARPGVYELESEKTRLRDVIARAGGLTPEAMPSAGIFLRSLGGTDPEKKRANAIAGVEQADPTSNGVNEILTRLSETKRLPQTGAILNSPLLHGLTAGTLNRMVVNMPGLLAGDAAAEVELADGDEVIIPRRTSVAYVVGETASPFASYKVSPGMKVKDLVSLAGGPTRNADTWHVRLLKADGRILDTWVNGRPVEPGDAVLVPQRIRRDSTWQENLSALTPLAILINAVRK
jgi:protein involved in polysaccharide export with SLBB domain